MVYYRRWRFDGGTYFFTVTLKNRQSKILIEHINLFRWAYQQTKKSYPFTTEAIVVMPEHIHCVWRLPDNDHNYSLRWRIIKTKFSQAIKQHQNIKMNMRGETNIWQRRFWEHTILSDEGMANCMNYIHYNPVKHGYVDRMCDWPFSSFHHYVRKGYFTEDGSEFDSELKKIQALSGFGE